LGVLGFPGKKANNLKKLIGIVGMNGSGKTTLIKNFIPFCSSVLAFC